MASNLPEDLLQNIFIYLQPELVESYIGPCSRANRPLFSSLANVCRASKTCYRLASPLLYDTIEIYGTRNYRGSQPAVSGFRPPPKSSGSRSSNLPPLRQVLRRRGKNTDDPKRPGEVDLQTREVFDHAIGRLDISQQLQSSLQDGLSHGLEDAMLAVFLALCPEVEHLEMIAVFSLSDTLTMALANELIANEIHGHTQGRPFGRLQSLASSEPQDTATDNPPPHNVSPLLTRLYIDRGVLDDAGLELLFKLFPSVRELSYSEGDMIEWMFEAERIGDGLRRHGTGQEKLKLDQMELMLGYLGDPSSLSKLMHFSVDVSILLGGFDDESDTQWEQAPQLLDILPASLQFFGLFFGDHQMKDYWWVVDRQLSELMGSVRFEALSTIELRRVTKFHEADLGLGWSIACADEKFSRLRRKGERCAY
ncbi:uncharacterized protein CLAFUR5_10534 [Fulvia fulva]|uniref:F-box domain-containing protein n=1 Tax=Passalora fulva TaxID=5499 RepID=A0A9Q8URH1_PASFU|nr:uncharacterized protein CLAFUR5_10534 [Fulvia fulva]KAK4620549.1 hypothetical protein CLAFUR0_11504 [Fulvia fulva]UJO19706.1 hypothetical protein CLAFUR5_10534 [Fulvia fulva]